MKENLLAAVLIAAMVSCSTPKYARYFHNYPASVRSAKANGLEKKESHRAIGATPVNSVPSVHEGPSLATSSTSNRIPENGENLLAYKSSRIPQQQSARLKQGGVKAVTTLKEMKIIAPESEKKGTKGKNGLATAGFILVTMPLLLLLVTLAFPGAGLYAVGFGALCLIVGIVFSAIGLGSEKKGMARAGLILGIIEIVGLIILIIAVARALSGI